MAPAPQFNASGTLVGRGHANQQYEPAHLPEFGACCPHSRYAPKRVLFREETEVSGLARIFACVMKSP